MPEPTSGTTIGRPDLGVIAFEYMVNASQRGFIGLELLPLFEVQEKSAQYPKIPIEALLKLPDTKRAARGAYGRGDWEFEMDNYTCEEHGWEEPLDDSEASLYSRFFAAEEISVMRATDILLRSQEKRIASMVMNASNLSHADVSVEWSTPATAVPRANINTGKTNMRAASGLEPNAIAMAKKVFGNLLMTAELKDAFKYTNPIEIGGLDAQKRIISQYFGVDRVLVGNAIYDSAKKGQPFSIADVWDDEYVLLAYITQTQGRDLREPVIGRTFIWTKDSPQNLTTEQYREEKIRSNIYRVRHNVDEAFVFAGAGYLLGNITA